MSVDESKQFCR